MPSHEPAHTGNLRTRSEKSLDALLIRIWRFRKHLVKIDRCEQLGLLYVATCAQQRGYKVQVYDPPSLTLNKIFNKLSLSRPRVAGFYCDHDNMSAVCKVSRLIKEKHPGLITIAGGPQADAESSLIMREGKFDVLVRGEGEFTFVELLDFYLNGSGRLDTIDGITFWQQDILIHNPDRAPNSNLDALPIPDRQLSELNAEPKGYESIICGRGCPYNCSFCAEGGSFSKTYRFRSPASVLDEVDYLLRERKPKYLMFMDDTFIANPARASQIAAGLKERRVNGHDFKWFCEARADILCNNPELIEFMAEAGLARIQIGIESGSQHILDAYSKGVSTEQILTAVKLLVEAGIPSIIGNFIIGGAHETPDSIAKSIDFAKELIELAPGRIELSTTYLTPYPNTNIQQNPGDFGLRLIDPECLTGQDDKYCFVETANLTKWQIIDAHETFNATCREKMLEVLVKNRIADETIKEHFLLFETYHLMTQWFQIYSTIDYLNSFYGLLLDENYSLQDEIPPDELPFWYPVRTYSIGETHHGKLVVKQLDGILEFDELGTTIYEHCSGRTNLARLTEIINDRFFPNQAYSYVITLVAAHLRQLEKKRLLVWALI